MLQYTISRQNYETFSVPGRGHDDAEHGTGWIPGPFLSSFLLVICAVSGLGLFCGRNCVGEGVIPCIWCIIRR